MSSIYLQSTLWRYNGGVLWRMYREKWCWRVKITKTTWNRLGALCSLSSSYTMVCALPVASQSDAETFEVSDSGERGLRTRSDGAARAVQSRGGGKRMGLIKSAFKVSSPQSGASKTKAQKCVVWHI